MEKNEGGQLVRALGLKESISMTIGTVVGVGLFTCGSSQIGYVGSGIIVITFLSLLISIWPCLIYGEMSAALPCAGGTYNYAKRGLNRVWANLAGWHYIISVVGIGAGETLAFSNYFKILFGELGINIEGVDSRIIAIVLVLFFLILNFRGIEMSGKAQTGFIFFFWGCAVAWFLYMIPRIHLDYFGGIAMDSLPPFKEMMYIFGLVWWCYTGFETCVSMGAETKYPQYTLPRALKVSVFLVFAVNALFQWFLVGLVPHEFYHILAVADAPYAEGLRAAGLVGFPIILLCIGIALSNRCGLPIIPTDLFPRELADITGVSYPKIKIGFDVTCLAVTAGLSCFCRGRGGGLGTATVLAAFTMGKGVGICGNWMDKRFQFTTFLAKRKENAQ